MTNQYLFHKTQTARAYNNLNQYYSFNQQQIQFTHKSINEFRHYTAVTSERDRERRYKSSALEQLMDWALYQSQLLLLLFSSKDAEATRGGTGGKVGRKGMGC